MALFSDAGVELLLRWLHFLAGITWIGLLYYFNFVQGPFFAEADGPPRSAAPRRPVRPARWWSRGGASSPFPPVAAFIPRRLLQRPPGTSSTPSPGGEPISTAARLRTCWA